MTRSAHDDPEVRHLLDELANFGYPMDLPDQWGVRRARKILKILISAATPGICPACGRRLE